jgi:hypothetical protein
MLRKEIAETITRSNQIIAATERTVDESRKIVSQSRVLIARSMYLAERTRSHLNATMPVAEDQPKIFRDIRLR